MPSPVADELPASPCLPHTDHTCETADDLLPIVLLHGFGGDRKGWVNIQTALASRRRSLAFDLPGHGDAIDWPGTGRSGTAARAVLRSLDHLGLEKVHLVGHSMGGAVSGLIALKASQRIASLTLLSPGGFGPEINHKLLRRYAKATRPDEMEMLLEQFFGWGFRMPKFLARSAADMRQLPGATDALETILDAFMEGSEQKCLPTRQLAELDVPIKVIWGTQDRVLPTRQAHKLPGVLASHIFERVGHMPHLEIPREVVRLILQNSGEK
ncbi:alpha/beta fold hydrolase [Roseibium sp.]|uniref:alpha/beta fold hydrolase n=1 Tax=Roseibium sp. TaxID=1936156 RepID=UPI003A988233